MLSVATPREAVSPLWNHSGPDLFLAVHICQSFREYVLISFLSSLRPPSVLLLTRGGQIHHRNFSGLSGNPLFTLYFIQRCLYESIPGSWSIERFIVEWPLAVATPWFVFSPSFHFDERSKCCYSTVSQILRFYPCQRCILFDVYLRSNLQAWNYIPQLERTVDTASTLVSRHWLQIPTETSNLRGSFRAAQLSTVCSIKCSLRSRLHMQQAALRVQEMNPWMISLARPWWCGMWFEKFLLII